LSETRRYRTFTVQQKLELVMASLRGKRSIAELCREHQISESLLRRWRDVALEAAGERLAGGRGLSRQGEQRNGSPIWSGRMEEDLRAGDPGKRLRAWE
jgi:transposase